MRIKNLEFLMEELKKKLPEYLAMHNRISGIDEKFQCPNSIAHNNNDATPSCSLLPTDDTRFHCFVCEESGDIFNAANLIEGRPLHGEEFVSENVAYLADKFKISYNVSKESEEKIEEHRVVSKVSEVLKLVATMLSTTIKKNSDKTEEIRQYVKERGWEGVIDRFELGWCKYNKLFEALKKRGYTEDEVTSAGITHHLLDNRLVIPIRNHFGSVVAFASRLIKKNVGSKYLNSRETAVYKKSEILFNLDRARAVSSRLYIVEGYADVITMVLHGIENVVALCGTAMTEKHYELLVRCGIREVVFCLDNESGARVKLDTILHKIIGTKKEIALYIKTLPKLKDPDEFVLKEGAEKFKSIPELSVFQYQLERFIKDQDDNVLLEECLFAIHMEDSPVAREKLLKEMVARTGIGKSALNKELQKFESQDGDASIVTVNDILEEQTKMQQIIPTFEDWAWSRGELLGLNMGWKDTTRVLDGLQNSLYLLMGKPNVGKSLWCLQLALNLITYNKDKVFVLYFSIDDNTRKVIPRLLANYSGIEINTVANPKFGIQHNKELENDQKLEFAEKRDDAVNKLRELVTNYLSIKDVNDGYTLEYFIKMVRIYKKIAGRKQLVVFIDNLHKMGLKKKSYDTDKWIEISGGLKRMCNTYDIPVFCTVEQRKGGKVAMLEDIKDTVDLSYDAEAVIMLETDFDAAKSNEDVKLFHIVDGSDALPVLRARVGKNKTSGFKGNLFYKFFPSIAKFEEVDEDLRKEFNQVRI